MAAPRTKEPSRIGLIAGEGRFPFMVLEQARERSIEVVTVAIEGEADRSIESVSKNPVEWITIGQMARCVRVFRDAGISEAVMAGRVRHVRAFQLLSPDRLMLKVLRRLPSRSTDAMLKTIASVLEEEGVTLLDSTALLVPFLADEGAMTKRRPRKDELVDMEFGLSKARGLAALDIGQTVVVKRKSVVVAEAMEGSDAAIRRAAEITEGPFAVVKVARPDQDFRFDVPVIGPTTIENMASVGATVVGVEAGRVLLVERDTVLERANREGIAVYGLRTGEDAQ